MMRVVAENKGCGDSKWQVTFGVLHIACLMVLDKVCAPCNAGNVLQHNTRHLQQHWALRPVLVCSRKLVHEVHKATHDLHTQGRATAPGPTT